MVVSSDVTLLGSACATISVASDLGSIRSCGLGETNCLGGKGAVRESEDLIGGRTIFSGLRDYDLRRRVKVEVY